MTRLYAMLIYLGIVLIYTLIVWILWKFLFVAAAAHSNEYTFVSVSCIALWLLGVVGVTAVCANTKEK